MGSSSYSYPQSFAVVDPSSAKYPMWIKAFNRDWIELESPRVWFFEGLMLVRAKLSSLTEDEVFRWAAIMGRMNGESPYVLRSEAYAGEGILINAFFVKVCATVEEGRQYWSERRAEAPLSAGQGGRGPLGDIPA
jgi:hypothetical protein